MHRAKKKRVSEPMEVEEEQNQPDGEAAASAQDDVMSDIDQIEEEEEGGIRIGDIYIPPAPAPALTFDSNGPRLIITHIVNENFKSYAGVQILGPFHQSFTAIIGPNGSGKSNVIDSMLFVFGYRASKIRSKKISVLIHSSSKFPNLTSASVAVHFCQIVDMEGESIMVVPNSEMVVSRTAFKDNSSHYTLNGRRVQFKEVGKMLKSYGIDLDHNRFLILQGEVEQIAMMKPKAQNEHDTGMLEYLEDIIGTARYKEPLQKLMVKVDDYSAMRKEKLNRVRLVEQEKQKLEEPMREAVDLMNLTNIATRTRNMLLQKYQREANKVLERQQEELIELQNALAKIDETLNKHKEALQEKTAVLKEGTKKYDTLKEKKEELSEKLLSCKKKIATSQSDLTQNNKKKKNLDQLLEQEKGKLIELELIPDKNKKSIEECEALLVKLKENKRQAEEVLQTAMASFKSKTQGLREQKDKLYEKLSALQNIVHEANNNCTMAASALNVYSSTERKEEEILDKLKESYRRAAADLEEKKPQQEELAASVPANERKLSEVQRKMQSLKQEEVKLSDAARSLRRDLEESRQEMSANRSRNRVLDALMKEKRNGNLPGIYGRLGDLGAIDEKYDVAISTCCGALDNIVVEEVDTAQGCVHHLKVHDIGRGTFIALEKQQHWRPMMEKKNTYPENVPRHFDLVKVKDPRVLPAFYYALRETLVAGDLEQATRIGYGRQRHRVVTLKGDVIETAGTMTGGGRHVMRGRMGSSVQQDTTEQDPRVLQAKEKKLADLEQKLSQIRTELSELEKTSVSLQRSTREGRTMLNKLNIELENLAIQLPVEQNHIRQQEAKVAKSKVDPERKAELEGILRAAEEKLEKAKSDAAEVEKEYHGVEAQISDMAGGKVKDLRKNVDDLTKKIDKVSSEITKLKVGINTSIRNATKSKSTIQQMTGDLQETEKNIELLSNRKKQLTLETQQLQKDVEELEEQISEGTGEFSDLRKEIAKLQTKENKLQTERLEAQEAVNVMEKSIQDRKAKFPIFKRDLASLKLEDPGLEGIPGVEPIVPLVTHTPEELDEVEVDELRKRLSAQKTRIGDKKPNIQAIQDYKIKEELYLRRAAELDEITQKRNEMRDVHEQLRKRRQDDFLAGFTKITGKLKEMYQMITLGGDAELELLDSMDPFLEGVIFSVRPPNKSWKNISNLSGGEKTLSSLALVFALHYYKPTPLYVMDEIDAALDFKNVSIVANYIKERTRNAQFIIISLRYNMFEVSNRLVGIYKTQDCTKSVTMENKLHVREPAADVLAA